MTSELLAQLHEANQRMRWTIEQLRQIARRNAALTPAELAELKWLAKDDQDATIGKASGDWTK